jgi:thiol:disulfide interchange protein DsbD
MRYLLALLLALPLFAQAVEGELLEPEQAFRFSARALDANTLEVRYQIADGYYLYRDRFKFQVEPANVTLGTPQFPAGQVKQDEYFGRVETYHQNAVIRLPLTRPGTGPQTITLKAVSQGCADAGLCYPPQTYTAKLDLPAAPPPQGLQSLDGGAADTGFLPPDQAFGLSVQLKDKQTVVASFRVADHYYLYRDRIKFSLKDNAAARIEKVSLPAGDIKSDPNFGKTEVYHRPFQAVITLGRQGNAATPVTLVASFQGCSEKGVCYPPIRKTFALNLAGSPPETAVRPGPSAAPPAASAPSTAIAQPVVAEKTSDSSRIATLLKGGSFWLVVLSFFGFGLLLALTPCVFPMIPILSGIIVGQGHHLTKRRGFVLSLFYVLGMAIAYAAAGVAAGLSGTLLSSALQNPWVLGAFALVFVALSLSMFGFYELQLPTALQSRFSNASNRMRGGRLTGVFAMGALSAVIVGPCVAAPLAGALLYIGQTRDVLLGGSALFAMALGMGVPLLLVGLSAGALLPKAGAWMQAVKSFFGVILLGVAVWLVSPLLPPAVPMLLWGVLLIISAIYLRAIDPLPYPASGFAKFWKGVGVVALIAGVALLIGVLSGSRDVLQPLSGLSVAKAAGETAIGPPLKFERIKGIGGLDQRLQTLRGKTVMLDFYADWCVSCKEMERFTFSDPGVQAKLRDTVLLQADVTANDEDDKALLKRFGLYGPPGVVFFDREGGEVASARTVGYEDPEKFLATLNAALR